MGVWKTLWIVFSLALAVRHGIGQTTQTTFAGTCNGFEALCDRPYSRYSMVGAHNSPFTEPGNVAANQQVDVLVQLDDGVRFLQGQMHWPADAAPGSEPHFCHTSCHLLDAGPISTWLAKVKGWVDEHPRDVVTILLGNGNYSAPDRYAPYLQRVGLADLAYVPPPPPLRRDDWPTLGEMLASGKRVVLLLDYKADQAAFPFLLDQFAYMWETSFNPLLGSNHPDCSTHRPADLPDHEARERPYILNHNPNVETDAEGTFCLVPALSVAQHSNAATGPGSLGEAASICCRRWDEVAPSVLNVDFYHLGLPPRSVFAVANAINNITEDTTSSGRNHHSNDPISYRRESSSTSDERVEKFNTKTKSTLAMLLFVACVCILW